MNEQTESEKLDELLAGIDETPSKSSLVMSQKGNGKVTEPPAPPQNAFQLLIPDMIRMLRKAYGDYQTDLLAQLPTMTDDELRSMRDLAALVTQAQNDLEHLATLTPPPAAPEEGGIAEPPTRDLSIPYPTHPVQEKVDINLDAVRYLFPRMEGQFDYSNLAHRNRLANWIVMLIAQHTCPEFGMRDRLNTREINALAAEHFFHYDPTADTPDVTNDPDKGYTTSDDCRKAVSYILQALSKSGLITNDGEKSSFWEFTEEGIDYLNALRAQLPR